MVNTAKFNRGDRVCYSAPGYYFIGTVSVVRDFGVQVRLDDEYLTGAWNSQTCDPKYLELDPSTTDLLNAERRPTCGGA